MREQVRFLFGINSFVWNRFCLETYTRGNGSIIKQNSWKIIMIRKKEKEKKLQIIKIE